jgi:hypothetical protein
MGIHFRVLCIRPAGGCIPFWNFVEVLYTYIIVSVKVCAVYCTVLVKYVMYCGCDAACKHVGVGVVSGGSNESWMCGGV